MCFTPIMLILLPATAIALIIVFVNFVNRVSGEELPESLEDLPEHDRPARIAAVILLGIMSMIIWAGTGTFWPVLLYALGWVAYLLYFRDVPEQEHEENPYQPDEEE